MKSWRPQLHLRLGVVKCSMSMGFINKVIHKAL